MKKSILLASTAMLVAASLHAQRAVAYEGGLLAHYTKVDAASDLDNGVGLGLNLDVYLLKRLALEYSGDAASHKNSVTNNSLTMVNHRFDLVYNQPLSGKWRGLVGGGWTGTRFNGDKTKNEYDSGVNALVGLRYCANDNWSWKVEGVGDIKDPSDQAPSFTRTTTLTLRFGVSRFFGGQAKNGPCIMDMAGPMPAPPPPAVTPAHPAAPQPAAPQPATAPEPPPQQSPPARQEPAPQPAAQPAPPPPAPPMQFGPVHFEFNKSAITKADRDTLDAAVRYLNQNPSARVDVIGHTDSLGTEAYNIRLGARRAVAVRTYLVRKGVAADRITTSTRGESEPIADNGTESGRAMNRRAVIVEIKP